MNTSNHGLLTILTVLTFIVSVLRDWAVNQLPGLKDLNFSFLNVWDIPAILLAVVLVLSLLLQLRNDLVPYQREVIELSLPFIALGMLISGFFLAQSRMMQITPLSADITPLSADRYSRLLVLSFVPFILSVSVGLIVLCKPELTISSLSSPEIHNGSAWYLSKTQRNAREATTLSSSNPLDYRQFAVKLLIRLSLREFLEVIYLYDFSGGYLIDEPKIDQATNLVQYAVQKEGIGLSDLLTAIYKVAPRLERF